MFEDMFASPSASGDKLELKNHLGDLLMIEATEHVTGIKTKFGEKDAVKATVTIFKSGADPEVLKDAMLFQSRLIAVSKNNIGKPVLGRVGQVPTDKGNPAWILTDATDSDKQIAGAYFTDRAAKVAAVEVPF
jgi:hypothetical protein